MSQAPSLAIAVVDGDNLAAVRANVSLKGTTRGLEILIASAPSSEALGARLAELLAEAPSFFAGSDARVAFEGALPAGALACLEDVATRFALTIVEIGPVVAKRARTYAAVVRRPDARPGKLAEGTGPISEDAHVRRGSEPRTALPSLPTDAAPTDGVPDAAGAAPGDADPASVALSDATPMEVELANTAPYAVAAIASAPAAGAPAEAALVGAEAAPVGAEAAHAVAARPDAAIVDAAAEGAPAEAALVRIAPAEAAAIEAALALAVPIHTVAADAARSHTAPGGTDAAASIDDAVPADAVPADAAPATVPADAAPATVPAIDPAATAAAIEAAAAAMAAELVAAMPPGPRLVIGPVRSGVIVDHTGHVIVIGDVNPGAEVRAEGSIIILGRLRGVAHAAIGREAGCIIALSLQPQQLRIGRMVARAGDADRPSDGAEIAYATGETIVVERFLGRLPSGLAASM
jgi:septum formation inhibitor MinC